MPRFVPVVDCETPHSERVKSNNSDYDKHRKFDNPHALPNNSNKKVVDRGWQQGNVGWGVLGSFGSTHKDDSAQVISRSAGGGKMVRNEKGLWVKSKDIDEVANVRPSGAGRGGGIPLFSNTATNGSTYSSNSAPINGVAIPGVDKSMLWKSASAASSAPEQFKDRSPNRRNSSSKDEDKLDPRDPGRRSDRDERRREYKEQIHSGQRHATRSRSRSRSRDRRDRGHKSDNRDGYRRDDHRRDDRQDDRKREDSRDRDRDRERGRDTKRHDHRQDDHRRDDRKSKQTAGSNTRMGDRSGGHGETSNRGDDSRRSDRRDSSRDRDPPRDKRSDAHSSDSRTSRDDDRKLTAKDSSRGDYGEDDETSRHDDESEVEDEEDDEDEDEVDIPFSISAIQVVNRLHEVFAKQTLFFSERVDSIAELFVENAVIGSLKKEGTVYLSGREAIKDSFLKTTPTQCIISKRVFIDTAADSSSSGATLLSDGENQPSPSVTFVLDLHRAGTAPGLGDKTKDTLLLYRCVDAHITTIWGMVDTDKMSSNADLKDAQLFTSDAWSGPVTRILKKDMPNFSVLKSGHAVYNNYDHMETWG